MLGVATYFAVPTLGPVYAEPQDFVALPHTYVTTLQEAMIQDRYTVLYDPFATHAVQTIAAFASLHVGIMVTVCLMAELLRHEALDPGGRCGCSWRSPCSRRSTSAGTTSLDALGGAVLGAAGVWIAALGTGNHVRGRPQMVTREPEPAPDRLEPAVASAE